MSVRTGPAKRRRAGMPFIIGGSVLAVLTAVAVLFYTSSVSGSGGGNVPVVVAAHDLQIRVAIQPGDLAVAMFHSSDVPTGTFTKISDIGSVVAAINIAKGQPVTNNLVLSSNDAVIGPQSAYLPIPSGYVAVTIPTGELQGVAGYIQVGDYLSLTAVIAGKTSTNVRTIYTNIPVIRVGVAPSESAPVQGNANTPPKQGGLSSSLTIIVTECQAEYINWFLSNGTLKYTLESYHDYLSQAPATDPTCPTVNAAKGVTQADIAKSWPGILN